jgi:hypothetical protein
MRPSALLLHLLLSFHSGKDLIFIKTVRFQFLLRNIYLVVFFPWKIVCLAVFGVAFPEKTSETIRKQVLIEKDLISMGRWRERARSTPAE